MNDYTSNISVVVAGVKNQLEGLKTNPEPVLRACAIAVIPEMRVRIHRDGKASDGQPIGTYSPGYMKVRTGDFGNSGRISRGPKKGQAKDAGTFTKKKVQLYGYYDKGVFIPRTDKAPRPKYNRTADTKVIISLTRQLENDYAIVPTPDGVGIGFNNPINLDKARWVEETYDKPILTRLTTEEEGLVQRTAVEFLPEYLKSF